MSWLFDQGRKKKGGLAIKWPRCSPRLSDRGDSVPGLSTGKEKGLAWCHYGAQKHAYQYRIPDHHDIPISRSDILPPNLPSHLLLRYKAVVPTHEDTHTHIHTRLAFTRRSHSPSSGARGGYVHTQHKVRAHMPQSIPSLHQRRTSPYIRRVVSNRTELQTAYRPFHNIKHLTSNVVWP